MIINRLNKREFRICFSEMICKLNHLFISPGTPETPWGVHGPCSIPLRIRCFSNSRLALNPKVSYSESTQSLVALSSGRISRAARSVAQDALFDYLHCTRGFHFTDADHMSKNSPRFLQDLLSKVENERDLSRAISRFLRYNPINEFEPFLESLGLTPSEIISILPRNLMFLNDDQVMLDNFHILCDYGIPRCKIGKIYKEANDIFRYGRGELASKLASYEELGLSRSTVIKLVSCCPMLLIGNVNREFVDVLEKLKAFGLESDWIGCHISGRRTYHWNRMFDTLCFLGEVGYTDAQMGILFKSNPAMLFECSGKSVHVFVGRLIKVGLKMNEICSLLLKNPQILSAKCARTIWRAMCFMYEIGMGPGDIAYIIATNIQVLGSHSLQQPNAVLKKLKVEKDQLCQIIKKDPLTLFGLASKSGTYDIGWASSSNPIKYVEKRTFLLGLGYIENSDEMTKALKQFRGRGDQLQERFDCLVHAGLDCNIVTNMIKHAPSVLNQTKDVLEKKIDCLRNSLGYPLDSIVGFPSYLCYDMERINLRFSMYIWLRNRGVAKPMLSLSTILACSDARFMKYFVDIDPEGPAMWESLKKSLT